MASTSPAAKPAKTMTMRTAAEVMMRPLLEPDGDGEIVVAGLVVHLFDA